MIRRLAPAGVLAAAVTLGLFLLMQALIASGLGGSDDEVLAGTIDFVRLKQDSELETKRRLPDRLAAQQPPAPPPIQNAPVPRPRSDKLAIDGPSFSSAFELTGGPELGAVAADTAAIPLVRIDPVYPPRALSRGLEGWVLVEFRITAAGTVADPVVVQADPPNVFNRAALKAIRRWKYKPRIVDGKPVDQLAQRQLIRFQLEK